MSDFAGVELIDFGPQVVIVDNEAKDAIPIEEAFTNLNVGNQFFEVDFVEPKFPNHTLKDVKLVFLDLHFNEGIGADFDPYICVDWIRHIIPQGRKYTLVVWSRDIEQTDKLLSTINEMNVTFPASVKTKRKSDYLIGNVQDNMEKMLGELGIKLKDAHDKEFFGKIVDIEDDAVLINCLLNENPKVFEVRRFDLQPFDDYFPLEVGKFIRIRISTRPGSRTINFEAEPQDLNEMFKKPNIDNDNFEAIDWLNTDGK